MHGVVLPFLLYGDGEFAARRGFAGKQFRYGGAAFLAGIPGHHYCIRTIGPSGKINSATGIDNDGEALAAQAFQHVQLAVRELEWTVETFTLDVAVEAGAVHHVGACG